MMNSFVPCPRCKRHIRASESACPFCRALLPADFGPAPRAVVPATGPFARAAILFMGATTSACSSGSSGPSGPAPVPFYGPAVIDGSADQDSGEPLPVVFYGPAIVDATAHDTGGDASAGDASARDDSGEPTPVPFYGPAVVDSGSDK